MIDGAAETPSLDYAVDALVEPGNVHVLLAAGVRLADRDGITTLFGYFDDSAALARKAEEIDARLASGAVWVSLNPVDLDAVQARAGRVYDPNKVMTWSDGDIIAGNSDVTARKRILIDFDALRESGNQHDPTTAEEHARAVERARVCRQWLLDEFEIPNDSIMYASSGNGAHLVVAVDLPADDAADHLVERFLAVIAAKFSDSTVKVDTAVKDRARKVKIPGTMARKGKATDERPHRRSRVIASPLYLEACPRELIEAVASAYVEPAESPKSKGKSKIADKIADGERNSTLTSMAGRLRRQGHGPDEILALLRATNAARCEPPLEDDELQKIANGMSRYAPAADPSSPVVRLIPGDLHGVVDQAEASLADRDPDVYQRGGLLVRVVETSSEVVHDGVRHPGGSLFIGRIERAHLVERLTRVARWERFDGRSMEWKAVDCPDRVAQTLDARGVWPRLRTLAGVIEAPTLRPDGTVLDSPGYDAATGLALDPRGVDFPPVPDRPSRDEAVAALGVLAELIEGFPFIEDSDRAAAVSAILTALVRRSLPSAPLHAFRAPTMRSGKSLLADVVSLIATGRPVAVMTQCETQEEERKRIFATLLEGVPIVSIDNCERPLGGATLCAVLTQTELRDRLLGVSRLATVPTTAAILATGNNLVIAGDLVTRVVVCDIDPRCERPEERRFDRDLYRYVPEHRGDLVAAGLTVMRAYAAAGWPEQDVPRWGGFDAWSRMVRSAIVWAGMADPTLGRRRIEDGDPVRKHLGALLAAWHLEIGREGVTVAEALAWAKETTDSALMASLLDVAGRKGEVNTRSLSTYLERYERRVVGGLRIERTDMRRGRVVWRVESC